MSRTILCIDETIFSLVSPLDRPTMPDDRVVLSKQSGLKNKRLAPKQCL